MQTSPEDSSKRPLEKDLAVDVEYAVSIDSRIAMTGEYSIKEGMTQFISLPAHAFLSA